MHDPQTLIHKYQIAPSEDGTLAVYGQVTQEQIREILDHKDEILSFFAAQKAAATEREEQEEAALAAIPGAQMLRYAAEKAPEELPGLQKEFPDAAFALYVRSERHSPNFELASIAYDAFRQIVAGEEITDVRYKYDRATNAFVQRHCWDGR